MTTILLNCVFLAKTEPLEEAEYIFLAIYTAEMIIKSVAKGFILNKYTYLRNPWNWLDFVVITSGYATIGMDVGNLAGLRTFRVLRALKTVSIMPGLKTIINALLHSFRQLAEVMTLTIFCLMVFALFALQVYMGELRNKCVLTPDMFNISHDDWRLWVTDEENWMRNDEMEPVICGNVTGARHCPKNYTCVRVGENPNHGYTNFDNFLWSMLTTFQLITLDYWENVYNMVLASCGPLSVVFFTVVVFFGSFYLINLMLAVVALSYEEEAEITNEERRKDLTDHRDDSTFSFDPTNIPVKALEKSNRRHIDSRKGVLLSSYTRKKTRRRKRRGAVSGGETGSGAGSRSVSPSPRHSFAEPAASPPPPPPMPPPQPPFNPDTLHPGRINRGQLSSRQASSNNSDGNNRESSLDDSGVVDDHEEADDQKSEDANNLPLHAFVQRAEPVTVPPQRTHVLKDKEIRIIKCNGVSPLHIQKPPVYTLPSVDYMSQVVVLDDLIDRNCDKCVECCVDYEGWLRIQNCLYKVVRDPLFELLITLCIILNTMFLATEHHGMSENIRSALDIGNKVFTSIFTLECTLKLMALSKEFFECGWNIFDLIIVSASLLDLSFELVDGLSVLRGLRLLRVLKLAQSWTTMKVLLSIIISTIGALGNLTFVLVIVIYIFAVIGMQLFSKDYTAERFAPDPVPRWNFSDFFHSFMMIFRILCGEWIEPLWDCMRAEKIEGPGTCFAIFLPALVMGNFMVLNLFLALLLNSFNSEELKSKKEPAIVVEDAEVAEMKALWSHHVQVASRLCRSCGVPLPPSPPPSHRSCSSPVEGGWTALDRTKSKTYPRLSQYVVSATRAQSVVTRPTSFPDPIFPRSEHYEEVGEDSKIARSFERIKSIIQKNKRKRRELIEKRENEKNFKLEELVKDVVTRSKKDGGIQETAITKSPRESTRYVADRAYCQTIQQVMEGKANTDPQSYQQNLPSSHSTPQHNSGYYDLASPPAPRLNIEVCKSPSPLKENPLCQVIPLHGDEYEVKIKIEEESEDEKKEIDIKDDALYTSIMAEAMSFAPTLNAPDLDLPSVDDSPKIVGRRRSLSSSPNPLHRQSYLLATRRESSEEHESKKIEEKENQTYEQFSVPDENKEPEPPSPAKKKPWLTLVSYVDDLTVGGRRDSQGNFVDGIGSFPGFGKNKTVKVPQDCFPQHCYYRSPCCDDCMGSVPGVWWTGVRTSVLQVVDTPAFEWIILVLIFSSSITLCFEDIYLDKNVFLKNILYWTNFGFCMLFTVEMMLKWVALGFYRYFTSFWTALDFVIVFVSIFSLLIEENENLKVLRSLRTLRALRPLRAISRWQGMRIVVNALMYAIPSIFNVLLVCLVFWLIFSIMGVQFFGGKFFKCVDEDGDLLPLSIVKNIYECRDNNFTWINSKITFDNVGHAYLALFQVATFEGWMEVMADAVDARGVDEQPEYEANLYAYIYFVIFIVCGSFFTLNLFIGVIIDNFNMLKKKYEGGVLEMFLTESQKHYYTAMKKLGRKKPQKVIKRPINQFLAMFYDLSNSRRFEIAIFVLIFLNMLTMGIEHYNQHHAIFFVLEVSNAFFTTVFSLEAMVKIIGLRYHYFTVPWNMFDFLLVLASILGILMEDIMIDFPVSPTLLRVVRVFRIGRILRLIKAAKGIRKLLFALVVSLPALFNIGALLGLITFIYAIIGMSIFGHVKQQRALNDMVNFTTFGRSMQLLFRLMTSAGWNDVLESLMIQPPDCNPNFNDQPNGDCGSPLLAITYFTSFIIISYMIVINMYIAIILENFNQAHQEEEIGIVEDDLEMFYIRWSKFDPHATQFIRFGQLADFIASLDPPLGIPKPNVVALVSFNLPIARGNKIHCLDILHALVKHVLGHVEETEEFKKLQDQMDIKFKKQFPTRKELEIVSSTRMWKRQDKAARTIQRCYREYRKRKKEEHIEDVEDENTHNSSPGGWQGRLSAFLHVHRGSRASSRKSSRASDASDISELGTMWLNLPLLLLTGTQANGEEEAEDVPARNDVCIMVSEPSPEAQAAKCTLDLPDTGVSITVTEPSPENPTPAPVPSPSPPPPPPLPAHLRRAAFRRMSEATIVHAALVHRESEEYELENSS